MTSPTPSEPRTDHKLYHAAALPPRNAWLVVFASALSIWVLQFALIGAGVSQLVAALVSDLAVLGGLAFCVRQRVVTLAALGVRWPRGRFLAAGACVGLAAWYLNLLIVTLVEPPGDLKPLERVVEQAALGPTIVVIAVFPALTEELVFRGVLARALAARYGLLLAVVISAALFGAWHLLPPQVLATFLLGLALSFIAIRADSVVPTMITHVLNNTIAIVISREELPGVDAWILDHSLVMLVGSLVLVGVGLALAARSRA